MITSTHLHSSPDLTVSTLLPLLKCQPLSISLFIELRLLLISQEASDGRMYRLLLSGHKPTFELYSFTPNSSTTSLRKISDSPAPPSATWLERSPVLPNKVYASSETENKVYSMMVEDKVAVVSERDSEVKWPVHCKSFTNQRVEY